MSDEKNKKAIDKLQRLTTSDILLDENGIPIEFCFTPGSASDIEGLKNLPCDFPERSILYGDKAYSAQALEDDLFEMAEIKLLPKRRKNLKRQLTGFENFQLSMHRNH